MRSLVRQKNGARKPGMRDNAFAAAQPAPVRSPLSADPHAIRDGDNAVPGHDFSRVTIFSEPAHVAATPVKLPPSPKPKKGEQPLGTLKDKQTGAEQKIYASFVTSGLWWFNGGVPTLADLYPTSASIPLGGLGKGKFNINVVRGADKVGLNGSGKTLSGDDLADVTLNPLAPSAKEKDVKVEVKHRPPGAKADTVLGTEMEVRAPHHLELLGTDHSAKGSHGFLSLTSLRVFDNFNKPMPFIDVNEDFGGATLEKGVASEWTAGFAARTKGSDITRDNAVFQDQYAVSVSGTPPAGMTPQPSSPKSPPGSTKVGAFPHDWYVGSSTVGKGVHVSHHTGQFYSDHAEYVNFKSPPAPAKGAAATPKKKKKK